MVPSDPSAISATEALSGSAEPTAIERLPVYVAVASSLVTTRVPVALEPAKFVFELTKVATRP